nr:hypothetical protein [Cupriavidus gilardii]
MIIQKLVIRPDWVPSPRNLNALPRPLRDYIMRLEACDPQFNIRKIAMLQEHIRMIEADNKRLRQELVWCREEAERYRDLGKVG